MSPYLLMLAALLMLSIYEFVKKETPKSAYIILFGILSCMLVLRYGQGTDYFGYYWIYTIIPKEIDWAYLMGQSIHTEIGWKLICIVFKVFGLTFENLVFVLSIIEVFLFYRFINKYCQYKIIALLMSYHTFYLTYMFSALRQGFVVSIFLGVLYEWYSDKKYTAYIIGVLFCVTLHSSAVAFLLVFLIKCKMFKRLKIVEWMIIVEWSVGIVLSTGILNFVLTKILPDSVMFYFSKNAISIASVERIVSYVFVTIIYTEYLKIKREKRKSYVCDFMNLYSIGMMIYGVLIWMPLVSSRLAFSFKVLEIAIVSTALTDCKKVKEIVFSYFVMFSVFMCVKNIGSYINDGKYANDITIINYPYVSVFDQDEIFQYREVTYDVE